MERAKRMSRKAWKKLNNKPPTESGAHYSAYFHSAYIFMLMSDVFSEYPVTYMTLGKSRSEFQWTAPDGVHVWCADESAKGIGETRICFELRNVHQIYASLECIDATDKSHSLMIEYSGSDHLVFRIQSMHASYTYRIPFERIVRVRDPVRRNTENARLSVKTYVRTVRHLAGLVEPESPLVLSMDKEVRIQTPDKSVMCQLESNSVGCGQVCIVRTSKLDMSERIRHFSNSDCLIRMSPKHTSVECKITTRCKSDALFISFCMYSSSQC